MKCIRPLLLTVLLGLAMHAASLAAELPPEAAAVLEEAHAAHQATDPARVVQLLEPLRQSHPHAADVHRLLGHSYAALGRVSQARESLAQALALGRLSSDVWARLADLASQQQDLPAMIYALQMLVAIEPDEPRWRVTLGDALLANRATQQARLIYEQALKLRPSGDVAYRLAQVAMLEGRPSDALDYFELAWRLGDRTPRLLLSIADLANQQRQNQRALEYYELAGHLQPDGDGRVALRRAQLRLAQGDLQRADAELTGLQTRDPDLAAEVQTALGHLRSRQSRIADAVAHFEQARKLGRSDPQLLAYIAGYYLQHQQFAEASVYLEQLAAAADPEPDTHRQLVLALVRSGQPDKARAALAALIGRFGLEAGRDLVGLLQQPITP